MCLFLGGLPKWVEVLFSFPLNLYQQRETSTKDTPVSLAGLDPEKAPLV